MKISNIFYLFMIFPMSYLYFYQIKIFKPENPSSCLKAFKSNNLFGLIIFLNILISKI